MQRERKLLPSSPGGASGLGAATTRMLVGAGGRVVIADLKEAEGQALGPPSSARTRNSCAPTSRRGQRQGCGRRGRRRVRGLHGLVNCAGIVYGERVVGKEGPHSLRASRARSTSTSSACSHDPPRCRRDGQGAPNAEGERGVIV